MWGRGSCLLGRSLRPTPPTGRTPDTSRHPMCPPTAPHPVCPEDAIPTRGAGRRNGSSETSLEFDPDQGYGDHDLSLPGSDLPHLPLQSLDPPLLFGRTPPRTPVGRTRIHMTGFPPPRSPEVPVVRPGGRLTSSGVTPVRCPRRPPCPYLRLCVPSSARSLAPLSFTVDDRGSGRPPTRVTQSRRS